MIKKTERNYDDDSCDEMEESFRDINLDESEQPYFSPEESKPPHY